MAKPTSNPLYRSGFCQGCKRHDVRLVLVAIDRYRCDECAVKEQSE